MLPPSPPLPPAPVYHPFFVISNSGPLLISRASSSHHTWTSRPPQPVSPLNVCLSPSLCLSFVFFGMLCHSPCVSTPPPFLRSPSCPFLSFLIIFPGREGYTRLPDQRRHRGRLKKPQLEPFSVPASHYEARRRVNPHQTEPINEISMLAALLLDS